MLPVLTEDTLDAWLRDAEAVTSGLTTAAAAVGLSGPLERFSRGSLPVAAVGDVVIKLFPSFEGRHRRAEVASLAGLDGALPVPTPRFLDERELPGWHVVVMGRLQGVELADRWPSLGPTARADLGRQVGECARTLNARPAPADVERIDWPAWVAERRGALVARQRRLGAPGWLVDALPGFLETADLAVGERGVGWLHTELMLEHLLVEEPSPGIYRLSGLFDFEPSMVGPVDYEWSSLGLFVARGAPTVWRAVLTGLGVRPSPEVSRRAFAMALVHRYAHLAWYLRRLPPPAAHLEAVIESWFGT